MDVKCVAERKSNSAAIPLNNFFSSKLYIIKSEKNSEMKLSKGDIRRIIHNLILIYE